MIKILKHGDNWIDTSVILTCDWCKCVMEIDNPENEEKFTEPDPHTPGKSRVIVRCPECQHPIPLHV